MTFRSFTDQLANAESEYELSLLAGVNEDKTTGDAHPLSALHEALQPTPSSVSDQFHNPAIFQENQRAKSQYDDTFIAKVTKETESEEFQPLTKLLETLQVENAGTQQTREHPERVFLKASNGGDWRHTTNVNSDAHKLSMLLDCGSPSTIVGVEDFKIIKEQYPAMIQDSFEYKESNKNYQFGGGSKTFSMGRVRLPIYVVDSSHIPHLLHVWIEVLNQPRLPLLLGGRSMTRVKGTLCFKTYTISMDWKEKRLCLPIKQEESGHFHLQFFPMSEAENNLLTREITARADWTDSQIQNIVTYIASEENNIDVRKIKKPERIRKTKMKEPLSRQQVFRLHQTLGHINKDRLKEMIMKTKFWNEETIKAVEEVENCEICAVEHNRLPRPKVAAPRSNNHNHIVSIDLKENTRYKNAPPFIIYFVDTFSRFKAASFIKNKRGDTIAAHIITDWIKFYGAPKYFMSDRGKEFLNGEVKELCQFHGIRFTTTASYSPHQNAYCERGHAVADRALERMLTADPNLKPEVALGWVMQAANTIQNVNGLVPFQIVFGRIPNHPSLVEDNLGANEEIADSQATWGSALPHENGSQGGLRRF